MLRIVCSLAKVLAVIAISTTSSSEANFSSSTANNSSPNLTYEKDTFETNYDGWVVQSGSWVRKSIQQLQQNQEKNKWSNVVQMSENSSQVKFPDEFARKTKKKNPDGVAAELCSLKLRLK